MPGANNAQLQVDLIFKTTGLIESIRQAKAELTRIQQGAAGAAPGTPRYEQAAGAAQQVRGGLAADVSAMLAQAKAKIPELRQAVQKSGLKQEYVRQWAEGAVEAQRIIDRSAPALGKRAAGAQSAALTKMMQEVSTIFQKAPVKAGAAAVAEDYRRLYMQPFAGMETLRGRRAAAREYERQLPVPPPPTYEAALRGAPAPPPAYLQRASEAAIRRAQAERQAEQIRQARQLYEQGVYGPLAPEALPRRRASRAVKISGERVSEEETLKSQAAAQLRVLGAVRPETAAQLRAIGVNLDKVFKATNDEAIAERESAAESRKNLRKKQEAAAPRGRAIGAEPTQYERVMAEAESYLKQGQDLPKQLAAQVARMEEARTVLAKGAAADAQERLAAARTFYGPQAFAKPIRELPPDLQLIEKQAREAAARAGEEPARRTAARKTTERAVQEEAKPFDTEGLAAQTRLKNARLATAVALQNAANAAIKEENATFLETQAKTTLTAGENTLTAAQRQEQGAISQYAELTAQLTALQAEEKAMIAKRLASDGGYVTDQATIQGENKRLQAAIAREVAAKGVSARADATITAARAQEQAITAKKLAGDTTYHANVVKATRAHEVESARIQEMLAGDQKYINATVANARAKELEAARIEMTRAGETWRGVSDERTLSRGAVLKRIRTEEERARVNMAMTDEDRAAMVLSRAAVKQRNAAINAEEAAITRALAAEGLLGGTRFQRWQTRVTRGAPVPTETPTLGQFVGQKTTTAMGWATAALPAMAIFGIVEATKEAAKLEIQFAELHSMLRMLGESDSFNTMRAGIKDIATETGQSIALVSQFYERILGISGSSTKALEETDAAMKLVAISGADLQSTTQNLVPAGKVWNLTMEEMGNMAVYLHDRFGVAEEGAMDYFGATSAAAEAAGASFEEMAVIGAVSSTTTGKTMTVLGEQMSKVWDQINTNATQIIGVLQRRPETRGLANPFIEAIGRGETFEAFKSLLAAYSSLDKAQKQEVLNLSAGRRERAQMAGIYENADKALSEMAKQEAQTENQSGKLNRRFEEVSRTFSFGMERLKTGTTAFLDTLAQLGAFDFAGGIVGSFDAIFTVMGKVGQAFAAVNEWTKGWYTLGLGISGIVGPFVRFAIAAFLVEKAMAAHTIATNISKNALAKWAVASGAGTVVEQGSIASKNQHSVANLRLAATEQTKTGAEIRGAAAAKTEAVAETGTTAALTRRVAAGRAASGLGAVAPVGGEVGAVAPITTMRGRVAARFPRFTATRAGGMLFGKSAQAAVGAGAAAAPMGAAGPIAIAAFVGMELMGIRQQKHDEGQAAADEFRAKMKAMNDEEIAKIANADKSFWDQLWGGVFDVDLAPDLAKGIQAERQYKRGFEVGRGITRNDQLLNDMARDVSQTSLDSINSYFNDRGETEYNLLTRGMGWGDKPVTHENFAQMYKDLEKVAEDETSKDRPAALEALNFMDQLTQSDKSLRNMSSAINKAVKEENWKVAAQLAGGWGEMGAAALDPTELQNEMKVGERTTGSYIAAMRQKIEDLRPALEIANREDPSGEQAKKLRSEMNNMESQLAQAVQQSNEQRINYLVAEAQAVGDPKKAKQIEFQTRMGQIRSMSTQLRVEQVGANIQMGYAAWEESLSTTTMTGQEKIAKRLSGWTIPRELRIDELTGRLWNDPGVQALLNEVLTMLPAGNNTAALTREIAEASVNGGKSVADAFTEVVKKHWGPDTTQQKAAFDRWKDEIIMGAVPEADQVFGGIGPTPLTAEETQIVQTDPEWKRHPLFRIRTVIDRITKAPTVMAYIAESVALCQGLTVKDAIQKTAELAVNNNMTIADAFTEVFRQYFKGEGYVGAAQIFRAQTEFGTLGEVPAEAEGGAITQIEVANAEADLAVRVANRNLAAAQRPKAGYENVKRKLENATDTVNTYKEIRDKQTGDAYKEWDQKVKEAEIAEQEAKNSVVDYEESVADAMDQWAIIRAPHNALARATSQLTATRNKIQRAIGRGASETDLELILLRQEEEKNIQDITEQEIANAAAMDKWSEIWARSDPLAQAVAQHQNATNALNRALAQGGWGEAELEALKQQQQQTAYAVEEQNAALDISALQLEQTRVEEDPVAAAKVALQIADKNVSDASRLGRGGAALNAALAEQMKAQRALRDAISQSADIETEMLIAQATAAGRPVEAAQLALARGRQKLAEAEAQRRPTDIIRQLTGEVATLAKSALDAEVQDAVSVIDFMMEMGQMTAANAIAALQVQAAKYAANTEEWRQLQLKIHTLQQSTKADLQFNIPSAIALPTLYEARRMAQSYMMGIGYNDARQVNVTVNVNGAQDPMVVSNQVVGAITSAMSTGTTYSPGVLVVGR
jgi:hypothetical protein